MWILKGLTGYGKTTARIYVIAYVSPQSPELTSLERYKYLLQNSVQKYTSLVMRPLNQDLLSVQLIMSSLFLFVLHFANLNKIQFSPQSEIKS